MFLTEPRSPQTVIARYEAIPAR